MGGANGRERGQRDIKYAPLPSQAAFHASRARFKGFSGPIGSGKSQALCHEALRLSYYNAGRLGLIGAPTYPMLRDATQVTLLSILEESRIPFDLNKAENVLVLKDTRSKILFRSLDDFERLRGTNLAWFGLDELTYTSEEAWLRLEGRLRDPRAIHLCGFAVWTPKGYDWVYRRFLSGRVPGYEAIIARPMENRHILDKVPDFYERLKTSYDERFYRQEVLGEYLHITDGLVYHAFDRLVHVKSNEIEPSKPLLWALDFNVDPMSSIVAQICDGHVRVMDEIVMCRASTKQACEEFHNRYGAHAGGVVVYADASGARMQTTGASDHAIVKTCLRNAGFGNVVYKIPGRNPPVRDRVAQVNATLKTAGGEVQLFIDPKCRELIKDLEEVMYKPETGVIDKERDPRRTHLSDALGYLIWMEFQQRQNIGEQQHRLF